MKFTKMQGAGNDFIIIEDLEDRYPDYAVMARKLCNRHFGIGADGLLVVKKSDIAGSRMLIYNSDGSQAEMCGNGLRCFARYIGDRGIVSDGRFSVETLDGIKKIMLEIKTGSVTGVMVNMGRPNLNPECIPADFAASSIIDRPITAGDVEYRITSLLMGVPHTVIFTGDNSAENARSIGMQIERSRYFPSGTNVNLVNVVSSSEIDVRTWERGAGLTLACGTGACASVVACVLNKKTARKAYVNLPGGRVFIEWADDGDVFMTGPAEYVCTGESLLK